MIKDTVQDALKWFDSLDDPEYRWSFSKTIYTLGVLDDDYDFTGLDITPLKNKLKTHKDQILAEKSTLPYIRDHRSTEPRISKKRFWWWIDKI